MQPRKADHAIGRVSGVCCWFGVQAAADEVLDDGVGVVGGRPGDADLAGADAGDGPVGDAGAGVVAGGGFGDQGDAVAVGDHGQDGVGLVGDGSDADRVALAFAGGQPVITPEAGFGGGDDERLIPGHAFQCLVTEHDLRASLTAIHAALRDGGRFAFETRHPQARAWQDWNPSNGSYITDAAGRALRVWHEVESVAGDVVTFTETTALADGTVLRVDRASLRFPSTQALSTFLAGAGFEIEAQYGGWHRGPITTTSREITTIARK